MYMMAFERKAASLNFRTYEASGGHWRLFWIHVLITVIGSLIGVVPFEWSRIYPVSTMAPAGGEIYYQAIAAILAIMEFHTIFIFMRLLRINKIQQTEDNFTLTERYQVNENVRMVELMLPVVW
ncbi:hypothetical protein PFISCL1PPCAC_22900 [Pristionchus fissidentatus]|uniref:G protein-coupled receptor n=1 Tax=Pristionchus fissidentatus TaxID=1538716 RepID=A0AAV5WMV9_9BILA|nr:hypothetical protein PFISCL1PPCAC_22900 [Pristionchus fissidentatus]